MQSSRLPWKSASVGQKRKQPRCEPELSTWIAQAISCKGDFSQKGYNRESLLVACAVTFHGDGEEHLCYTSAIRQPIFTRFQAVSFRKSLPRWDMKIFSATCQQLLQVRVGTPRIGYPIVSDSYPIWLPVFACPFAQAHFQAKRNGLLVRLLKHIFLLIAASWFKCGPKMVQNTRVLECKTRLFEHRCLDVRHHFSACFRSGKCDLLPRYLPQVDIPACHRLVTVTESHPSGIPAKKGDDLRCVRLPDPVEAD